MQIETSSSTLLQQPVNEYSLEGGVTIKDKTNGLAKAVLAEKESKEFNQPCYNVIIANATVHSPTGGNLIFGGSKQIKLKLHENLIKITEFDGSDKTTVYANNKCNPYFSCSQDPSKNFFRAGVVNYFLYIPKEISAEEASQKVQNLIKGITFEPLVMAYNSHGVVVFGKDSKQELTLYWANPDQTELHKMEFKNKFDEQGMFTIVNSTDQCLSLRYLNAAEGAFKGLLQYNDNKTYYINNEKADPITLT